MTMIRDPKTGKIFMRTTDGRLLEVPRPELSHVNPGFGAQYVPGRGMVSPSRAQQDLLSRLPAADISGVEGIGVVPGGDQKLWAKEANQQQEGMPLPPHNYRPLGGAKQNFRGASAKITIGGPEGTPPQQVNGFLSTPRSPGDDAELITVCLGIQIQGDQPTQFVDPAGPFPNWSSAVIRATGILDWGVGGAQYNAELDWIQGTIISIPASYMKVSVRVDTAPGEAGDVPLEVAFHASYSYGTANSSRYASPSRKTVLVGDLNATAFSDFITIPLWANSFNVVSESPDPPNFNVRVFDSAAFAADITNYNVISNNNNGSQGETQFPIPNGGRFLQITNSDIENIAIGIKVIFNLAF